MELVIGLWLVGGLIGLLIALVVRRRQHEKAEERAFKELFLREQLAKRQASKEKRSASAKAAAQRKKTAQEMEQAEQQGRMESVKAAAAQMASGASAFVNDKDSISNPLPMMTGNGDVQPFMDDSNIGSVMGDREFGQPHHGHDPEVWSVDSVMGDRRHWHDGVR
jgi:regulator of protease activity HflC (stomatin/prohibitin superfamily)